MPHLYVYIHICTGICLPEPPTTLEGRPHFPDDDTRAKLCLGVRLSPGSTRAGSRRREASSPRGEKVAKEASSSTWFFSLFLLIPKPQLFFFEWAAHPDTCKGPWRVQRPLPGTSHPLHLGRDLRVRMEPGPARQGSLLLWKLWLGTVCKYLSPLKSACQ